MKAKRSIRSCPAAIALAFGLMCPSSLYALTEVYNTEGTFEWVCPVGVTSITVERGTKLRRFSARAKGRGVRIEKPTCHISITVGN